MNFFNQYNYGRCLLSHISECWWIIEKHHIVYRSEAPKHKNLNNPQNILLCCTKHHKRMHEKKDRRRDIVIERDLSSLYPDVLHNRYTDI